MLAHPVADALVARLQEVVGRTRGADDRTVNTGCIERRQQPVHR